MTHETIKKRFEDLNSAKIRVGQDVILTIINEGEFSGKISLINAKRDRLQLADVTFCRTKTKLTGVKKFYKQEIKSIEIISEDIDFEETEENHAFEIDNKIKFEVCGKEYEKIQRLISNHCTINCVGEEFDKALDEILKQNVIGLHADGVEEGRNGAIRMIGISTPFSVYIFNIRIIGGIDNRLKDILKSEELVKVIHDARLLAENLFHCHDLSIKGIFDTMVVHRSLGYSIKVTTLQECITEHMILPSEEISGIEESTNPIKTFINSTAILLKFHDFLTEHLLKNAYEMFNDHLNYCRNKESVDLQLMYRRENSIVQKLNDIPPFKLFQKSENI